MTDPDTVATYQSIADEYRERHGDRSGVEELVEEFLDAVEDATDGQRARIADVGCGPGWESATFADCGHEVVGVDITPAFLRIAREEALDASLARMDMRTLGFDANVFDALWACASFLHVPRREAPATLREFRRVLRPGAVVYLSVKRGNGEMESDAYEGDGRRFTLYHADELRSLTETAGFEVESVSDGEWIRLCGRA